MKELLIVNNNMNVGGVQKSLCNLLWSLDPTEYHVTLLLFSKTGAYLDEIPDTVRVIEETGPFRLFGKSQKEYKGMDAVKRTCLALICRFFGRDAAVRMMRKRQPSVGRYDCAISFLNNGPKERLYGGAQDFVLYCTEADRKVLFLHGDYDQSGCHYPANDWAVAQFDTIAACSEGCHRSVVAALPHLADRCVTVRNCHRYDDIRLVADDSAVCYDPEAMHAVMVARLSHCKGIDRAIRAVATARKAGYPIVLHIVGDGPLRSSLHQLTEELAVTEWVIFHGEQRNPYPYIKRADLMLITSYHEAAPMVIDEARCLGVPVMSTKTSSSQEMIIEAQAGWVCDNDQTAIDEMLCRVLADREGLMTVRQRLLTTPMDNRVALEQFSAAVSAD
ncbi:MAG: glycosyltransferase [Clostridia bacterium]|nr:glycosyltransferase [Clostridia bacterium]